MQAWQDRKQQCVDCTRSCIVNEGFPKCGWALGGVISKHAFGNSLHGFGPGGKVQNKMQELDDVLAQCSCCTLSGPEGVFL